MDAPRWFEPDDETPWHVLELPPLDERGTALELHVLPIPGGVACWWLTERGVLLGPARGGAG